MYLPINGSVFGSHSHHVWLGFPTNAARNPHKFRLQWIGSWGRPCSLIEGTNQLRSWLLVTRKPVSSRPVPSLPTSSSAPMLSTRLATWLRIRRNRLVWAGW